MGRRSRIFAVAHRISKLRRSVKYDTQMLRLRLIRNLEQLFNVADDFARGKIQTQTLDGEIHRITMKQRQMWARIAAYIAQILNATTKNYDERELDKDMDKLEALINEAVATGKAESASKEA